MALIWRIFVQVGFVFLLWIAPGRAQTGAFWLPEQNGESLQVSLVTVGPGTVYWQLFGHNALWIKDKNTGYEVLYHYGVFDFSEKNFFLNFARGKMQYRMVSSSPSDEFELYRQEGREVRIQELNLSPSQRVRLVRFLEHNVRPENAKYAYNYFVANCATKIRDALDHALDGKLRAATKGRSRGSTSREQVLLLASNEPWVYLAVYAGLGPKTDRPIDYWDEMFMPPEVGVQLSVLSQKDDAGSSIPIVARDFMIAQSTHTSTPKLLPDWSQYFLGFGLFVALLMFSYTKLSAGLKKSVSVLVLIIWTVGGLCGWMLALAYATEHRATWGNLNILLFNPMCLALLPSGFHVLRGQTLKKSYALLLTRLIVVCVALAWVLQAIPGHRQDIFDWFVLWLPIHLASMKWISSNTK